MAKREIKLEATVTKKDLGMEDLQIKKITTEKREFFVAGKLSDPDLGQLLYDLANKEKGPLYDQIYFVIFNQIKSSYNLSKEIGCVIDQNNTDYNNPMLREALVEIYEKGFKKYEFSILEEDVETPPAPEKVKIRITAADFPELPKSIKKITINGKECFQGVDGKNGESLGMALGSRSILSLPLRIAEIVNQKFPALQTTEKGIDNDISEKYYENQKYCQSVLLEKIWNEGIELEFEISEEEVFPAL